MCKLSITPSCSLAARVVAGSDIVTVALFAPRSTIEISQHCSDIRDEHLTMQEGDINEATCKPIHQIIVTSGYDGEIKVGWCLCEYRRIHVDVAYFAACLS